MNDATEVHPKLEAPGAGLPYPELMAARLMFQARKALATRDSATAIFRGHQQAVSRMARKYGPELGKRRVLIPRLRGMEDSSRYWSAFMVLDHLQIVNSGCMEAIRLLSRGQAPARTASTAAVKPSPDADESVIERFEQGCELFCKTVERIADLKTKVRYAHPWFGELDADGWHFMAGFHMGLHRKQLNAIIAGLA
jgi:hypothetical protein